MKPNVKPASGAVKSTSSNLADKYAILQRKVDELERVHNEDKKSVRNYQLYYLICSDEFA